MPEKILVVEDEPALQETIAYMLKRQGYAVDTAGDGLDALDVARRSLPDLVVLDIMLPRLDGLEVCRILRQETSVPILMLTAKDEEIDRVIGLEIGADDYMSKPFSNRELLARVRALLRRVRIDREQQAAQAPTPKGETPEALAFGNLVIDLRRREVRLDDKAIPTKPKEYDLLLFLATHRGQALSREQILERVWGWDFGGGSRTVDVHVRWLREKIEPDPSNPARIITVHGAGYRFEG